MYRTRIAKAREIKPMTKDTIDTKHTRCYNVKVRSYTTSGILMRTEGRQEVGRRQRRIETKSCGEVFQGNESISTHCHVVIG
jgi:hypothetical protein